MAYVQSTALEQLSYNGETHTLFAKFRTSSQVYAYQYVPQELYDALIFADSLGAYFNAHIRDAFPYIEVANED